MGRLADNAKKALLSLVHDKYRNRSHAVQYSDESHSHCHHLNNKAYIRGLQSHGAPV